MAASILVYLASNASHNYIHGHGDGMGSILSGVLHNTFPGKLETQIISLGHQYRVSFAGNLLYTLDLGLVLPRIGMALPRRPTMQWYAEMGNAYQNLAVQCTLTGTVSD